VTGEVTRPSYRPRVLIGVGRQQERRLMQALGNDRTLQVVGRCNSATELLSRVGQEDAEVVVLDDDLHLLDSDRLQDLTRRRRLAVVLLVHDRESDRWRNLQAVVLPSTADLAEIRVGVDRALGHDLSQPHIRSSGGTAARTIESSASAQTAGSESTEDRRARIIALFGGAGAAGKTTTAVNLLTVLGVSRRAVLVDLDTTGASVAAHLRAVQPAWNILDVALKAPRSPETWGQILDQRLQRIGSFSQGARVLCGIGRPRERTALTGGFVESLVAYLAQQFDHVLLDLGDEPLCDTSTESMVAAAALRAAEHVLLVAAPDPASVHHAQMARDEAAGVLDLERTWLVLNRCGRGEDGASSAAALELPLLARIPFDPHVQQALAEGQPAVCQPGSRLRRPIGELAERIAAERVEVPTIVAGLQRRDRLSWLRPRLAPVAALLGGSR
jgi:MinD-like ATPase involved in chromosome partitioning or flagellar assembly